MRKNNGWRIILVLIVLLSGIYYLIPTILVYSKPADSDKPLQERAREIYKKENPKTANRALNLGLDLAGGTHIIVEVKKDEVPEDEQKDILDRSLEIIRNRVDQFGLSEPIISKSGDKRIVAELAGLDAEASRRLIGSTALLEFKLVAQPAELVPVLNRIDEYLRKHGGPGIDTALVTGEDIPESESETMFGRVLDDTAETSLVPQNDTTQADTLGTDTTLTDTVAETAEDTLGDDTTLADESLDDFKSRPFSSLLRGFGDNIAVPEEKFNQVKQILQMPEIKRIIPYKYQILWSREVETTADGAKIRPLYLVKRRAEMTGKYISDASFQRIQGGVNAGEIEVALTFKGLGPKEFGRITGANIGRQLAIILDSVVYSAPVIRGKIPTGRASITGLEDLKEAKQLAVTLRAGSLPAPMEIVELRSIGPSLGEENINKGLQAAIVSLILVMIFMVLYYSGAGIIADLALILNLIMIVAILGAFHATLTLPGLAGIILTIGMAVDANVIIFERIREELRIGRTARSAIDAGFGKAFSSIFDANVTTFGTAAVLYYIGEGPIKGFGLTLMIGIATSMFTALFVSRLVFDVFLKKGDRKDLPIGKGIKFLNNANFKIISHSKKFLTASAIVLILGIVSLFIHGGLNLGIDFTGGNVYQVKFQEAPQVESVRQSVEAKGFRSTKVQTVGQASNNELMISIESTENDSLARQQIEEAIGANAKVIGEETVGPTIGKELQQAAFWAIIASLIIIIFYIWLRFGRNGLGFGLGAVIALAHDSIITLGLYNLFGLEISLTFVAAILAIIGYSLNDSIIIFDRIRENLTMAGGTKGNFPQKVNDSINETLSRTLITSGTSLMVVVILAIFGGSSIRGFNIALIIGLIAGTYSTIGIATPFVIWWERRRIMKATAPKKAKAK